MYHAYIAIPYKKNVKKLKIVKLLYISGCAVVLYHWHKHFLPYVAKSSLSLSLGALHTALFFSPCPLIAPSHPHVAAFQVPPFPDLKLGEYAAGD